MYLQKAVLCRLYSYSYPISLNVCVKGFSLEALLCLVVAVIR
jgi:hypothetical protein